MVGVSGYTVRPPEARRKPRVSAFIHADYEKIEALEPDLILGFSDLQADIAAELIKRGYPVMVFNQRSVAEILQMIRVLGGTGRLHRAGRRARRRSSSSSLDSIRAAAAQLPCRPRVFFEEWDDPLISGIRWVEELVEIAGGEPIFPELRDAKLGKQRIVGGEEVIRRQPDVIIASWCGKAVRQEKIAAACGMAATSPPSATATSTRSSRRTSCSRVRRRSPTASASCTTSSREWRGRSPIAHTPRNTAVLHGRNDAARPGALEQHFTARRPSTPRSTE